MERAYGRRRGVLTDGKIPIIGSWRGRALCGGVVLVPRFYPRRFWAQVLRSPGQPRSAMLIVIVWGLMFCFGIAPPSAVGRAGSAAAPRPPQGEAGQR